MTGRYDAELTPAPRTHTLLAQQGARIVALDTEARRWMEDWKALVVENRRLLNLVASLQREAASVEPSPHAPLHRALSARGDGVMR